nr:hypothetical protein [uncultured Actinoplanes sp.]
MLRLLAGEVSLPRFDDSVRDLVRQSWAPYRTATVTTREVALAAMRPIARSVRDDRLELAARLLREFHTAGIAPYLSVLRENADGLRFVLPPIVEWHTCSYHVVDGMHRLFAARGQGLESVFALVVESSALPPPTLAPCEWAEVKVVDYAETRDEKFPGFVADLFRPTAKFLDARSGPFFSETQLLAAFDTTV